MHIYFSGIGGSGISALAHIALDLGFQVSGSEIKEKVPFLRIPSEYSLSRGWQNEVLTGVTLDLQARGAKIEFGQDGSQIAEEHKQNPIDWFIHTAALKPNHPELLFAKENNLKISKRDEFINFLLSTFNLKLIAVAGTHGKTTTTSMIVWLFKQLQIPVSYLIGSTLSWERSGKYEKDSQYFVMECDEFDRNFLHFKPEISVITSIDYDHPDTYPSKEEYYEAFNKFMLQSKEKYIYKEDADKISISADSFVIDREMNYGYEQKKIGKIKLAGRHNRKNAYLVYKLCYGLFLFENFGANLGFDVGNKKSSSEFQKKLISLLETFPGINRRFEKLGENLYSDYAHHPTEIKATLQLAKEIQNARLSGK